MPRKRTPLQRAAGRLLASVQKEWHERLGEPGVSVTERAMDNAQKIFAAAMTDTVSSLLSELSVTDFIGTVWVKAHPRVLPAIQEFERVYAESQHA